MSKLDKLFNIIESDLNQVYLIVNTLTESNNDLIQSMNNHFNKKIVNVSYIKLNELINKLYFEVSDEMIINVMNKFDLSYKISKMYLDNVIKYLYINECNDTQMNEIINFIDYKKNKYSDPFINMYLSNKKIIVVGRKLDKFEKKMLSNLDYTKVEVLDSDLDKEIKLEEYSNITKEIAHTFESISTLINEKNVDINDIYIACNSSDYSYELNRISKMYNFNLNINTNYSLYETVFVKAILEKIFNKEEIKVEELNDEEYNLYKQTINVYNTYVSYSDNNKFKEFIINKLKNTSIYNKHYKNGINVIDIRNSLYNFDSIDNKYVYVLGVFQTNIPSVVKDEDYISDNVKLRIGLLNSNEQNIINTNIIYTILNTNNFFHLSYSLKSNKNSYIVSSLINNKKVCLERSEFPISKYSDPYNIETYMKLYDLFIKYGMKSDTLYALHKKYNKQNDYKTYDNNFTGLDDNDIINHTNKISLSYSAMESYQECAFKYYLTKVLCIEESSANVNTFIGNVFHGVLDYVCKHNFVYDFEDIYNKEYNEYLKDYKPTISEEYLISNLKKELLDVIEFLKEQLNHITYKDAYYEEEVLIKKDVNINGKVITKQFRGFIDKIYFKKDEINDSYYVSIVDYKTSENIEFDLELAYKGLGLQLPIYAYMAKNITDKDGNKKYNNLVVGGFYIQPILSNSIFNSEEYLKEKRKARLLKGYTNSDTFDTDYSFIDNYKVESIIKNLKVSKEGKLNQYAKTLNTKEIDDLVDVVDKTINDSFDNIIKAKFDINPKKFGKDELGCSFCKFKDVCFKNEKNILQLKDNYIEEEDSENTEEGSEKDE